MPQCGIWGPRSGRRAAESRVDSGATAAPTASPAPASRPALPVVLRCERRHWRKACYVFDTLLQASAIAVRVVDEPPQHGPWLLYAADPPSGPQAMQALFVVYQPEAWRYLDAGASASSAQRVDGLPVVFLQAANFTSTPDAVHFDLAANAFYFLSSWAERSSERSRSSRQLFANSEVSRLGLPQDPVDRYLAHLVDRLNALSSRLGAPTWPAPEWPDRKRFAVVLTHDVDYLPVRPFDNAIQCVKAILRHLWRQRDPGDAWRAARGWLAAIANGRDPYGCVPEIIAREQSLGVRSSFQVAVGHRHANDVNYRIEDDRVRDYLRAIMDAGFDLCLHGSYRSTEQVQWYVEEVELLRRRLARPLGSRQHFLSFDYDTLHQAQELAGIRYDMSMGYPDQPGPRAGFSYPYFPYNLREDRPYRVLQLNLFLMDVTLRSYLGLRPEPALSAIEKCLQDLHDKRGGASVVWHPIVFGGARDPGYGELYFDLVRRIGELGGWATDGRSIDSFWRAAARSYGSFVWA